MTAIDGLGERGKALWESLGHESPATAEGAMALEAARLVDRLEELNSIIQGKGVLELMQFRVLDAHMGDDEDEKRLHVEVKFNNVLAEARQQQNVLRQMLVTLAPSADAKTASTQTTARPSSVTDEFTKRRRERGA